jgi:hypothetical protein
MTQPGWKYALLAIAVVSMSLGAACKKADNTSDTGAAAGSSAAPAAGAMGASGAAGASGASQ